MPSHETAITLTTNMIAPAMATKAQLHSSETPQEEWRCTADEWNGDGKPADALPFEWKDGQKRGEALASEQNHKEMSVCDSPSNKMMIRRLGTHYPSDRNYTAKCPTCCRTKELNVVISRLLNYSCRRPRCHSHDSLEKRWRLESRTRVPPASSLSSTGLVKSLEATLTEKEGTSVSFPNSMGLAESWAATFT